MTPSPNPSSEELKSLIAKYTAYCECDEWHIHTGEDKNADPADGHVDFDEDKFESALLKLIEATCLEVIGADLGPGDDETFAYYENNLRAEQRNRLAQLMKEEE